MDPSNQEHLTLALQRLNSNITRNTPHTYQSPDNSINEKIKKIMTTEGDNFQNTEALLTITMILGTESNSGWGMTDEEFTSFIYAIGSSESSINNEEEIEKPNLTNTGESEEYLNSVGIKLIMPSGNEDAKPHYYRDIPSIVKNIGPAIKRIEKWFPDILKGLAVSREPLKPTPQNKPFMEVKDSVLYFLSTKEIKSITSYSHLSFNKKVETAFLENIAKNYIKKALGSHFKIRMSVETSEQRINRLVIKAGYYIQENKLSTKSREKILAEFLQKITNIATPREKNIIMEIMRNKPSNIKEAQDLDRIEFDPDFLDSDSPLNLANLVENSSYDHIKRFKKNNPELASKLLMKLADTLNPAPANNQTIASLSPVDQETIEYAFTRLMGSPFPKDIKTTSVLTLANTLNALPDAKIGALIISFPKQFLILKNRLERVRKPLNSIDLSIINKALNHNWNKLADKARKANRAGNNALTPLPKNIVDYIASGYNEERIFNFRKTALNMLGNGAETGWDITQEEWIAKISQPENDILNTLGTLELAEILSKMSSAQIQELRQANPSVFSRIIFIHAEAINPIPETNKKDQEWLKGHEIDFIKLVFKWLLGSPFPPSMDTQPTAELAKYVIALSDQEIAHLMTSFPRYLLTIKRRLRKAEDEPGTGAIAAQALRETQRKVQENNRTEHNFPAPFTEPLKKYIKTHYDTIRIWNLRLTSLEILGEKARTGWRENQKEWAEDIMDVGLNKNGAVNESDNNYPAFNTEQRLRAYLAKNSIILKPKDGTFNTLYSPTGKVHNRRELVHPVSHMIPALMRLIKWKPALFGGLAISPYALERSSENGQDEKIIKIDGNTIYFMAPKDIYTKLNIDAITNQKDFPAIIQKALLTELGEVYIEQKIDFSSKKAPPMP